MIRKGQDIANERMEKARGGAGFMLTKALINDEQFCGKGRMFNHSVLEPGSSVGVHKHSGDVEVYYILSGEGTYNDNGTLVPVKAGDVTYCPDGEIHGIENTGKENLEFLALILYS